MTIRRFATLLLFVAALPLFAQDQQDVAPAAPQSPSWDFRHRFEIRANWRESDDERFQLRFPFRPGMLPPGQTAGFLETVDPGGHAELSVVNVQLDASYGTWVSARAKVHFIDKYRRNPTTTDRKIDADELWIRFGDMPEFLERPEKTSFFLSLGKQPRMERQPTRLLESYGLASTSFNRFEDVQIIGGGTIGRNFYWRLQGGSGNPLFMRDANALAGDNGTPSLRDNPPRQELGAGFPILYNAETEGLAFDTSHPQFGQAVGYRWAREDQTLGFDFIAFHYRRTMADRAELHGTFYGGDLDLLDAVLPGMAPGLPISGRMKEEYGGRFYGEWRNLTAILQFTKQQVAGLQREGWEGEFGYSIPFAVGPQIGGETLFQYIQPAGRLSGITNRFTGAGLRHPAPSLWWNWAKIDAGVRVGFAKRVDLTVEYSRHNIGSSVKLRPYETLVTLRVRI